MLSPSRFSPHRQVGQATHPAILIAAFAVTAVCIIAAWQLLSPKDARSRAGDPSAAASAPTSAAANSASPSPAAPEPTARPVPKPSTAPAARPDAPAQVVTAAPPAPRVCADCGVVQSVRESKQAGEGSGAGAVIGGVVGGVLGNQVGGGRGRDLATVAGAVGGAVAGHQIEKHQRATTIYHVDVKMDDGSTRTINLASNPNFALGTKVRVNGNQIALR